jgi:NAD(P)-dependent dehydrogenase (short-subunit alcohol dehydrogenase family)
MGPAIYPSLKKRTVLLTGGAGGIGAAIVEAFCHQKASVAFVDIDDDRAAQLCEYLRLTGAPTPHYFPCNICDVDALRRVVAQIEAELGPLSVLVNNAADDRRQSYEDLTVDEWDAGMAVNLRHHFFAIQAAAPQMRSNGGGAVVNVGSIAWRLGDRGMPVYTCAKAAIEGLTKSMARELGPHRIRVNCVAPGWVMTEKQLRDHVTPEAEVRIRERQCLPDPIAPAAIANMVLFLSAADSSACKGQTFVVDGGWC